MSECLRYPRLRGNYVKFKVIANELWDLGWQHHHFRQLILRIQGVGATSGHELVHFGPSACNVVYFELAVRLVGLLGDDDPGTAFFDVIVSVIEHFARVTRLLEEGGARALDVGNVQGGVLIEVVAFGLGQALEVHGGVSFVVIFHGDYNY